MTDQEKRIARDIGFFLAEKCSFSKQSIIDLFITNISFDDNNELPIADLVITLGRPGCLIGKKGETINALSSHLSSTLNKKVKISVVGNEIKDFLLCYYDVQDSSSLLLLLRQGDEQI